MTMAKTLRCGGCNYEFETPPDIARAWANNPVTLTVRCPKCANPGLYGTNGIPQTRRYTNRPA
jgi:hypothetical protein